MDIVWNPRVPRTRNHSEQRTRKSSRLVGTWHSDIRDVGRVPFTLSSSPHSFPPSHVWENLQISPVLWWQPIRNLRKNSSRPHHFPHPFRFLSKRSDQAVTNRRPHKTAGQFTGTQKHPSYPPNAIYFLLCENFRPVQKTSNDTNGLEVLTGTFCWRNRCRHLSSPCCLIREIQGILKITQSQLRRMERIRVWIRLEVSLG